MSGFASVSDALDLLVEPFDVQPDWESIVRDAGHERRPRRRGWAGILVAAAALLVVLVAAAFASGLADRFSAWIGGTPGTPAPAPEQAGFDARNDSSLAAFPRGTRLRLILRRTFDGVSFDLLGFRNGDAYCLRLVRTAVPNAAGRTQCVRSDELSGHVALVADDARFDVGRPAVAVTGIYGFASDGVRAVHVVRARTSTTVPATDNVFLALAGQRTGTGEQRRPPNPVLAVGAVMKDGTLRNVPYVVVGSTSGGVLPGGKVPRVPSYFGAPASTHIPGAPTKVTAPIADPHVGWLDAREKRGAPLPKQPVKLTFGRVIQPDPDDPVRVGVAVGPASGITRSRLVTGDWTCLVDFVVLGSGGAISCTKTPFAQGPISSGGYVESPIVAFSGLAADGVARIEVFLASGLRVRAALRDNVYSVSVPEADLPGELVAYDSQGKVAGLESLPGNAVAKPCPPAELTTPTSKLAPPQRWERVDLSTLTVDGHAILGATPAQVVAALGKPALIRPRNQVVNNVGVPAYDYGGTTQATAGLEVVFLKRGSRMVANELLYQSPSLVDERLGHVLRAQPVALQARIEDAYGSRYRLTASYGGAQLTCTGVFQARTGAEGFSFGLDPHRPSRPFLEIVGNARSLP